MKYEKCLHCNQLGTNCDGPNLLLLEEIELGQWLNELRKIRGLTYDKTQQETGVSKTALYNFLTGAHPNCKLDTVLPLAKKFIGGDCDDNPCGNVTNSEKVAYEERIRQLEKDIIWHEDKIKSLEKNAEAMQTLITNTNVRNTQDKDFLRGQIKSKNRAIVILSVSLAVCLLAIITALIIDRTNSGIGFFWLESWFKPHGINEIIQQWRT